MLTPCQLLTQLSLRLFRAVYDALRLFYLQLCLLGFWQHHQTGLQKDLVLGRRLALKGTDKHNAINRTPRTMGRPSQGSETKHKVDGGGGMVVKIQKLKRWQTWGSFKKLF